MKRIIYFALIAVMLCSCNQSKKNEDTQSTKNYGANSSFYDGHENGEKSKQGLASIKEHSLEMDEVAEPQREDYTYYKNAGFAIDRSYKLQRNSEYIAAIREARIASVKLIDAYICTVGEELGDPYKMSFINLNINEMPSNMSPQEYLDEYKSECISSGISAKSVTWHGCPAVEYSFEQDWTYVNMPTRALFVCKGNKSFLIQLGSMTDVSGKYNQLKNSIILL